MVVLIVNMGGFGFRQQPGFGGELFLPSYLGERYIKSSKQGLH